MTDDSPVPAAVEFDLGWPDGAKLDWMGVDAERWVAAFLRTVPVSPDGLYRIDDHTALTWFANAIEAGRDAGNAEIERLRTELATVRDDFGDAANDYHEVVIERDVLQARIDAVRGVQWNDDGSLMAWGWNLALDAVEKALEGTVAE